MTEIVIVANAFGADPVWRSGHSPWLGVAADAGAHGFEVRRELFASDADASHEALARLGAEARKRGLWCVYSTPACLYIEGRLDHHALATAQAEADALGARYFKLQLGTFTGRANAAAIARICAQGRARLLVENGQRAIDDTLARFVALFDALAEEGAPDVLGMTFDIGNWQWAGEAPLAAAQALAEHVEYIHCKGVTGSGARRFACAPAADDPFFPSIFAILPRRVPRAIEFPLAEQGVADDARRRVAWLAAT
ncbi:MAG: sugar phosphate isomerase/epimerase [Trinickia sp.]|jgi:sugar phosphate isomerase/epimerase|uniref:sugar phosphate isomerase/epimerase n=1 Tax=Trinickia sp. TaxID=2571163 RepID=UPI003F8232D9